MSQTGDDDCSSNDLGGKRERKMTGKALLNKIEKSQNECKIYVNKMKGLIQKMKALMQHNENLSQIKQYLVDLKALCEKASSSHVEVLSLVPEEVIKQEECFSSIMKYTNVFLNEIQNWINQREQNPAVCPKQINLLENNVASNTETEVEDDIKPSDSVSVVIF